MDDYELIDVGSGARLEQFGPIVTDRPCPGAIEPRRAQTRWAAADVRFHPDHGWRTIDHDGQLPEPWTVELDEVRMELRLTETGQVGIFPEHRLLLPWLTEHVVLRERPEVLHLFAYTGLATLAMAEAGASVVHVDASRPSLAWARRNAALSGLDDRPIRWLVDDARAFVARELRRSRRYDGIVLDPPTYGHGRSGRAWRIATDLPDLLAACREILRPEGFIVLTAHTEGFDAHALANFLDLALRTPAAGPEFGELTLHSTSGHEVSLGAFARWTGGA